jgi:hypothetical protein
MKGRNEGPEDGTTDGSLTVDAHGDLATSREAECEERLSRRRYLLTFLQLAEY